ncbi:hypothetical protein SPG90_04455 [Enterobacter sp. D2]|uniref:hypothetical protein n=1 Tax=unclassified Enterobacter TaxID=2608935 RepID=UPI002ACA60FE|nr:hypothetical protein [Enterobacter sp. D2]MDZ5727768.1 hypothetical protein [Enterobacter sp. D2]
MTKKFGNARAERFLKSFIDIASLDSGECNLSLRCKFNFSYFDSNQEHSGRFSDWSLENICEFIDKLIDYSSRSLGQLQQIGIGKNRNGLLSFYDAFPPHSLFTMPKSVPHQARWGRFRLDQNKRLVGFVVPDEYHGVKHESTGMLYDKNTFYVVFLDNNHDFYPPRSKR